MNQFTENSDTKKIINLALSPNAVIQILNYDFSLPKDENEIFALNAKDVDLLIKWEEKYGIYDINKK